MHCEYKLTVAYEGRTYNPESNPFAACEQGLAKVDCVAVWFFCLKVKVTVSPGAAV